MRPGCSLSRSHPGWAWAASLQEGETRQATAPSLVKQARPPDARASAVPTGRPPEPCRHVSDPGPSVTAWRGRHGRMTTGHKAALKVAQGRYVSARVDPGLSGEPGTATRPTFRLTDGV